MTSSQAANTTSNNFTILFEFTVQEAEPALRRLEGILSEHFRFEPLAFNTEYLPGGIKAYVTLPKNGQELFILAAEEEGFEITLN